MNLKEQIGVDANRSGLMIAVLCLYLSPIAIAQDHVPQFNEYPVSSIFEGDPATPILDTPEKRMYRTRIREGITKGWGVHPNGSYGPERPGPNFAGHYIVITWGCGSGCLMMVIVDAITGHVYPPPLSVGKVGNQKLGIPNLNSGWADFHHDVGSRLFVMKTCPGSMGDAYPFSGTSYFTFGPSGFKLIKRVKCEPEDSNGLGLGGGYIGPG